MSVVFIGGAREIKTLPQKVQLKLNSICNKNYYIIVGDANGVDKQVQQYFYNCKYNNIKIFASNGKARNNIGNWTIQNVEVPTKLKGFDFYKQKDLAMAKEADIGFMIWNEKSRGTLNNIINLLKLNKEVIVYLKNSDSIKKIENFNKLNKLINLCSPEVANIYKTLLIENNEQLSIL